jgi:hypothetical protein
MSKEGRKKAEETGRHIGLAAEKNAAGAQAAADRARAAARRKVERSGSLL